MGSVREFRAEVLNTKKNDTKLSSSVSTELNTLQEINKSTNDSLERRLAGALKIKQMQATGQFSKEVIDSARKDLGIADDSSQAVHSTSATDALANQLAGEVDPQIRQNIINQLIILDTYNRMDGRPMIEIQAAINSLKTSQEMAKKTDTKTEDFRDKMMDKFIDKMLAEPKSELDSLKKIQEIMKFGQTMQSGGEDIDGVIERIEKYKKAGFVREAASSPEELQLQIEKLKVDNAYKLEERKIVADESRTKNLTSIGTDIISSTLEAVAASGMIKSKAQKGTSAQVKQETLKNAYQVNCAIEECGSNILVSNADVSRNVKCPGCNTSYYLDADKKELHLLDETPAETSQPSSS